MTKTEAPNAYEEAIARFINGAIDAADKVGQFAVSELPHFVSEVLNWYFAYHLILFICGIVLSVLLISVDVLAYKAVKKVSDDNRDYLVIVVVWGVFGTVCRTIAWGVGVGNLINLQWLKIWIAPKLWLIEYAARILK